MERTLKLRNAVTFVVGIVIGSGIFASPGFVIAEVGSPGASLCVWALCGMLTTMGSLSMAELSAALPSSGGEAVCVVPLTRTSAEWTQWLALWPLQEAPALHAHDGFTWHPAQTLHDHAPRTTSAFLCTAQLPPLATRANCVKLAASLCPVATLKRLRQRATVAAILGTCRGRFIHCADSGTHSSQLHLRSRADALSSRLSLATTSAGECSAGKLLAGVRVCVCVCVPRCSPPF
jgi:hypothetical protein